MTSTRWAGVVIFLVSWPVAALAQPHSLVGEQAPTLDVRVVAGKRAGTSYCLTCTAGSKPLVITFVDTANDMVADYAEQLDALVAKHHKDKVDAAIVFLGDAAADEARLKEIATTRRLQRTSLAVLDKPEELSAWSPEITHPTNAYVVKGGKVVRHFSAACPLCDKLHGRISKTLWTLLSAGRGTWGAVASRTPTVSAQHSEGVAIGPTGGG